MNSGRMLGVRLSFSFAVVWIVLSGAALGQSGPGNGMSNDDVVKMVKLGFDSDVIQSKINQAGSVSFKLDVDDLEKLKSAGVSQGVIAAMLKRSSAGVAPATAAQGSRPGAPPPVVYGPGGIPVLSDIGAVTLVTKDHGSLDLRSIGGSMSTTYAFVTVLMHVNFPGEKADLRTQDRRPTLVIKSGNSPKGRMYMVSAESDNKNSVRSVKMGNSRMFGAKNIGAPDSDNQIEYDVVAEGTDSWRLTPKKDLRPGEYGLWSAMQMYDFGVDP